MATDLQSYGNLQTFPTPASYTQGLVNALDWVAPVAGKPFEQGGLFTPPIGMEIATVKAVIESETGMKWGQLVDLAQDIQALAASGAPSQTLGAIHSLVDTSAEIVVGAAQQAADVAGDMAGMAEAIPAIGAAISTIAQAIATIAMGPALSAEAANKCRAQLRQYMGGYSGQMGWCQGQYVTPSYTGRGGTTTAADIFRPVFFGAQGRIQSRHTLPISVASLYVVLCGEETQGFYTKPMGPIAGKKGIAPETKRRMWALLKAIRECTLPPDFVFTPFASPVGDDGQLAMSMLQDILWNEWQRGQLSGGQEGLDTETVALAAHNVLSRYKLDGSQIGCKGAGTGPAQTFADIEETCAGWDTSGGHVVDLVTPFVNQLKGYSDFMAQQFFRDGQWQFSPTTPIPLKAPMVQIVLGSGALKDVERTADRLRGKGGLSPLFKLLLAGGAAYGGYRAARHFRWLAG